MATECRGTESVRVNRNKLMKACAYGVILFLVLMGGIAGFFLGMAAAPNDTKFVTETVTETVTEIVTVEVPVYEADKLPKLGEVVYYNVPLSNSLQRFIYEVCADESVPVALVMAMIEHESQFDPEVVSSTEDYGLMQINAVNHEWLEEDFRCADMLNPYQNVFCGVKIIGKFVAKYNDYNKALMAYNMGDYGARSAWENGIDSTKYSTTILELMRKYEKDAT